MKSLIIAREREQATLKRLLEEPTAQFLAVYGRRRIGKTFLIRKYFDDNFAFRHTAISPLELEDKDEKLLYKIQLEEFAHSLEKYGAKLDGPLVSWFDAFHKLEDLLDRKRSRKKMVVFIDELPWLDTAKSGFMSAFEHFWNGWGAGKHNLLLIVCGRADFSLQNMTASLRPYLPITRTIGKSSRRSPALDMVPRVSESPILPVSRKAGL